MNAFPFVVLLSEDTVLGDLLHQLLSQDRFLFRGVGSADEVLLLCARAEGRPAAILIDAIESASEARQLLSQASERLVGPRPAIVLLVGSTTPQELSSYPLVDGVLTVPIKAGELVEVLSKHARNPPRAASVTGIQRKVAVDADHTRAQVG